MKCLKIQNRIETRKFKMTWARLVKLVTKMGIAALVVGALATAGKAQNVYQGKFTLPSETRWGGATLPAGDYTFTLPSGSAPYRLYVRGEKATAIIQVATAEGFSTAHAQLNLVDIADVYTVESFDAPELGKTFIFWTPSQKHMSSKEARQKTLPQTAPASQVSENKVSVDVHSAGR
jgi:hypothetical protein